MKPILLVAFSLMTLCGMTQTDSLAGEEDTTIYKFFEVPPEFQGGNDSLSRYLKSVHYPAEAKGKNITGSVFIEFVIEKSGKVSNAKVVKGADEILNAAAIEHIRNMPVWKKPAYQYGKKVRVLFQVPIRFKLE